MAAAAGVAMVGERVAAERLAAYLERARAGAGSVVVITGAAGSGKTTLARRFADEAAAAGTRVVWSRAWAGGDTPPFWPWQEIVRQLEPATSGDTLREVVTTSAAEHDRFPAFEAVLRLLRSSDRPTLVVLDGLDQADPSAVELAAFLARYLRTGPVLVVLTCRERAVPASMLDDAELVRLRDRLSEPDEQVTHVVAGISAEATELLRAWAVLGAAGTAATASRVAELPSERLARPLREVGEAGLLDHQQPFDALPPHVREVIAAATPVGALIDLHERALAVLESTNAPARRLAVHARAALAVLDPKRAYAVLAEAGRDELRELAWEDARRNLDVAVTLAELANVPRADLSELRIDAGNAALHAGATEPARAHFLAAADDADASGDAVLLARCALGLGNLYADHFDPDLTLGRLLRSALRHAPPEPWRSRLTARLAVEVGDGDPERAAIVAAAEAQARACGDEEALWWALQARGTLWHRIDVRDRARVADELLQLAERRADPLSLARAHGWQHAVRMQLGDGAGADAHLAARLRYSGRTGDSYLRWHDRVISACRALLEGDLAGAEADMETGVGLGRRMGRLGPEMAYGIQRYVMLWLAGDPEATLVHVEAQLAATGFVGWRCARSAVLADMGRVDESRAELDGLAADGFAALPPAYLTTCLAMLATACAGTGAADHAATVERLLEPAAGTMVVTGYGSGPCACLGAAEHWLGLLAAAQGKGDRAAGLLAHALDRHRQCGWPAMVAVTEQALTTLGASDFARRPTGGTVPAVLARAGRGWRWHFAGEEILVPDRIGVRYLAQLLAAPAVEFPALDLAGGAPATGGQRGIAVLDDTAKRAYRSRIAELEAEIDDADARCDYRRSDRAHAELEAVLAELRRAVGLGARDRSTGSDAERARSAVTKAIRGEIRRTLEDAPALGRYLLSTVRTGAVCSFVPDPNIDVAWSVSP